MQLLALARTCSVAPFFACLIVLSCAHETKERPREGTPAPRATRAPLPFPDTAFRASDDERPPDRFATRTIEEPRETRVRYTGRRIDLDVKSADVHDVFRLLAEVGHANIVVAGDVTGTITLKLKDVPWDQALDVVAKARGLAIERDGNVILVTVGYPDRPR